MCPKCKELSLIVKRHIAKCGLWYEMSTKGVSRMDLYKKHIDKPTFIIKRGFS